MTAINSSAAFSEFMRHVVQLTRRVVELEKTTYPRGEFLDLLHAASHNGHEYNAEFLCEADAEFFYNLSHSALDADWKWSPIPSHLKNANATSRDYKPPRGTRQQSLRERNKA
jgi:hypothetical protein